MNRQIDITISGKCNSGKTMIAWRLAQVLREEFGIECDTSWIQTEGRTPDVMDEHVRRAIDDKTLRTIGTTCAIKESQLRWERGDD